MPKAILEFNLPEERIEFDVATHGGSALSALHQILELMRREWKYNDALSEVEHDLIERLRTEFYQIISEYDIPSDLL